MNPYSYEITINDSPRSDLRRFPRLVDDSVLANGGHLVPSDEEPYTTSATFNLMPILSWCKKETDGLWPGAEQRGFGDRSPLASGNSCTASVMMMHHQRRREGPGRRTKSIMFF